MMAFMRAVSIATASASFTWMAVIKMAGSVPKSRACQLYGLVTMENPSFLHIAPTTMSPCSLAEKSPDWMCLDCRAPHPWVERVDIRIHGSSPGRSSLTFADGIPIAHKDELLRLGTDEVAKSLFLGEVRAEDGRVLSDWLTWRGIYKVIVRGDKHAGHRSCKVCGRDIYFAMGKQYLHGAPPMGVRVMQHGAGLVVEARLAEQLDLKKWRGVHVTPLPILATPLDGLPSMSNPAY
jgi:hypothetical protein